MFLGIGIAILAVCIAFLAVFIFAAIMVAIEILFRK